MSTFLMMMDWVMYFNYSQKMPNIDCQVVEKQFGQNLPHVAYIEQRFWELSNFPNTGYEVYLN